MSLTHLFPWIISDGRRTTRGLVYDVNMSSPPRDNDGLGVLEDNTHIYLQVEQRMMRHLCDCVFQPTQDRSTHKPS